MTACPYGCPWTLHGLELDEHETEEALAAHVAAHLRPHAASVEGDPRKPAIIAALQRWHAEHGTPPAYADWSPTPDGFPAASTVRVVFGSWAAGQAAAGLTPRMPGRPKREPVET